MGLRGQTITIIPMLDAASLDECTGNLMHQMRKWGFGGSDIIEILMDSGKTYAVESPAAAPREPAASDVRAHAHGAEGDRGQDRGRDGRRHHPPLRQLQRDGGPGEPGLVERWEHL